MQPLSISKWKRKHKPSKRSAKAIIPACWDDRLCASGQEPTSVEIARVVLCSGTSMFHRLAFVPNAFEMSKRDRLIALSIESANTSAETDPKRRRVPTICNTSATVGNSPLKPLWSKNSCDAPVVVLE
jgi:hypothetical protein